MTFQRQHLGQKGEKIARLFLEKQGYKIITGNYKTKSGEIDLIAMDGETLVFVEVKTRSSDQYGSPLEALTFHKCRQISKVALEYLLKNSDVNHAARFDVVAVRPGAANEVELVKNAFDLCYGV